MAEVLGQLGRDDEAFGHWHAAHRLDPDDVDATVGLAANLTARHRVNEAVKVLEDANARAPNAAELAGSLAWLRATAADAAERDGAEAVRLAEHACTLTGYREPDKLDTLAAAYAEVGRFEEAVATARRALAAADPASDLPDDIRGRIALYQARRPYRSP